MAQKDNSVAKTLVSTLTGFFKGDTADTYDGKGKKALALNSSLFQGSFNDFGSIEKYGLRKPSKITFANLRQIAKYDPVIRICVNVIKKEVSQAEWSIIPKRDGAKANPEHIEWAYQLFERVNANGENLRELLDRILEDLLVLDAAVIEKVFNAKGELMELNSVDGATIRPVVNEYGELDEKKAYVQVINEKVVAQFAANEIMYMMQSPQNDIDSFGYGMSPIESILLTVQSSLNAEMYNARVFSEDNIPPGILDLGDMNEEEAQSFIALWNATVVGQTHKLKFAYGHNNPKKYIPFVSNNKDMQFVEYIDWLSRVKLATYGLTTLDANITQDVNRSTAQAQENITSSRGVRTVKRLLEDYIDREVFMPMGFDDISFKFETSSSVEDKKKQAEVDKIYIEAGVYSPADVARREGFEDSVWAGVLEEGNSLGEVDYGGVSPVVDEEPVEEDVLDNAQKKGKYFKPLYK